MLVMPGLSLPPPEPSHTPVAIVNEVMKWIQDMHPAVNLKNMNVTCYVLEYRPDFPHYKFENNFAIIVYC